MLKIKNLKKDTSEKERHERKIILERINLKNDNSEKEQAGKGELWKGTS